MAIEYLKPFYNSAAWKQCRKSFIKMRRSIDGGMCQRCGKELGFIVHHKIPLTSTNVTNAYIATGFDNLAFLCNICHEKVHGRNKKQDIERRKIEFDRHGDMIL